MLFRSQKKQSVVVGFGSATVSITPTDAEWNAGEKIPVSVVDSDANKNSRTNEDLHLYDASATLIPSLRIGSPFTLGANGTETTGTILAKFGTAYSSSANKPGPSTFSGNGSIAYITTGTTAGKAVTVNKFSDRALIPGSGETNIQLALISYGKTVADLKKVVDRKSTRLNSSH